MKYTIPTLLIIVALYYVYNHLYIGVNGKCKKCKKNRGYHNHYILPFTFASKMNIDLSGHHCDLCMKYPGHPHLHMY